VLLQSALPTITGNGTWIDGYDLSDGCVCPRIDASLANSWTGNNGLTINASCVTISNITVVNVPAGADISVIGGILPPLPMIIWEYCPLRLTAAACRRR
jgi:hypothetical protein